MENISVRMEILFDENELNECAKQYTSESDYIDMIDNVTETLNKKIIFLQNEKKRN